MSVLRRVSWRAISKLIPELMQQRIQSYALFRAHIVEASPSMKRILALPCYRPLTRVGMYSFLERTYVMTLPRAESALSILACSRKAAVEVLESRGLVVQISPGNTYSTSFLRFNTRPIKAHSSLSTCSPGGVSMIPRSIS